MMKNLSDNLNLLMAKARINSSDLAKLTGLPATTIKRIRNNEQSNPTISTLLPLADYFSITISDLVGHKESQNIAFSGNNYPFKQLPLLSWEDCARYDSVDRTKIKNLIYSEIPTSENSYATVLEGEDLESIPKHSVLIVDPAIKPKSGDFVLVTTSTQELTAIKKYIYETDQVYLRSLVEGIGITPLTSKYKLLGVIVQYKVTLVKYG